VVGFSWVQTPPSNVLNILNSPLEQFRVLPVFDWHAQYSDLLFTNETLVLSLCTFFLVLFYKALFYFSADKSLFVCPNNWQIFLELVYKLVLSLVTDNIKDKEAHQFFPMLCTLFSFVLLLNLIGLVPYSFTLTSHLILTFTLSISIFIGINIMAVKAHGLQFFGLFLPAGTSVSLSFLLVPIELVSYFFKPISLGIRLFANMMAGHTLLKVIAGFCATMVSTGAIPLILLHFVPLLILVPLYALELGVALIQSFVFVVLVCIYLQDSLYAKH